MGYIQVKCTNCGKWVAADSNHPRATCTYCQATFSIDNSGDSKNNYMNIYNNSYQQAITPDTSEKLTYYNGRGNKPKNKHKITKKKLLSFMFLIIFVVSGVMFYIEYTKKPEMIEPEEYKPTPSELEIASEETEINGLRFKLAKDVDFAKERKKHNNPDIIARLEIPELFNVLVVKSDNNSYYLNYSINRERDVRGSEFLDYRVKPTSKQVNIYGHNSRDPNVKVAFLKLEKFLKKDYFDSHPYIILQYDGGKSLYEIKAIKEIYQSNREHMYVDLKGQTFVNHVKAMTSSPIYSRNVSYDENSKILVLQTCSHHWDNAFYIITAVKLDYKF